MGASLYKAFHVLRFLLIVDSETKRLLYSAHSSYRDSIVALFFASSSSYARYLSYRKFSNSSLDSLEICLRLPDCYSGPVTNNPLKYLLLGQAL